MALSRGCTLELLAALAGHFHPVVLVEADHPGGVQRVHGGLGTISWNGEDWLGLGKYAELVIPEEDVGLVAAEATVVLVATLEAILQEKGTDIRNLEVRIWFGVTTTAGGNTLVPDAEPVPIFYGFFDTREIRHTRDDKGDFRHELILGIASGPSARSSAAITHGPEDQTQEFPGDTAGRHVIHNIKKAHNPPTWPEL